MSTTTKKQYTAADWPFWHPEVNPLAPETPPHLTRVLDVLVRADAALRACMKRTTAAQGPGRRWSRPALDAALTAERRAAEWQALAESAAEEALVFNPGFHRAGDCLVGLVWRSSGPRLEVKPAFIPWPGKGV